VRVILPLINLQYVFHCGNKGGVGVRRDDPLLFQMRLENVFFSVRPIVLSLAFDDLQFDDRLFQQSQCPAGPAGRRFGTRQRDQPGLGRSIKDAPPR
jgi:hypothetical protein